MELADSIGETVVSSTPEAVETPSAVDSVTCESLFRCTITSSDLGAVGFSADVRDDGCWTGHVTETVAGGAAIGGPVEGCVAGETASGKFAPSQCDAPGFTYACAKAGAGIGDTEPTSESPLDDMTICGLTEARVEVLASGISCEEALAIAEDSFPGNGATAHLPEGYDCLGNTGLLCQKDGVKVYFGLNPADN
jgi:hypothetical protein